IRKARTDPAPLPEDPAGLEARPEAKNLVGIYAELTGDSIDQVLGRFAGEGFGAFKPVLADALIATLAPLRGRLEQLLADPAELDRLLAAGSERAAALAAPTLADAYRAVGLRR
ncbi:MAG: tryptophan--tRNA ligase, partial [Sphingomicrobium sp.]